MNNRQDSQRLSEIFTYEVPVPRDSPPIPTTYTGKQAASRELGLSHAHNTPNPGNLSENPHCFNTLVTPYQKTSDISANTSKSALLHSKLSIFAAANPTDS